MAVASSAVDSVETHELDARALTEYMTVLEDTGRVRGADGLYLVVSQSGSEYLVDPELPACECPDNEHRDRRCKHIRRVRFALGWRPVPHYVDQEDVDPDLGRHVPGGAESDDVERGDGIETDGGEDLPALHIGDHVQDREDDDATLLVVGLPLQRAGSYVVDEETGETVADYNAGYDAEAHAIEVIYAERTDVDIESRQTYAFPRPRLELVGPIHDRSGGDSGQDTDDGRVEPTRSEPADFGGGDSTGVQNL